MHFDVTVFGYTTLKSKLKTAENSSAGTQRNTYLPQDDTPAEDVTFFTVLTAFKYFGCHPCSWTLCECVSTLLLALNDIGHRCTGPNLKRVVAQHPLFYSGWDHQRQRQSRHSRISSRYLQTTFLSMKLSIFFWLGDWKFTDQKNFIT